MLGINWERVTVPGLGQAEPARGWNTLREEEGKRGVDFV